MIRLFQPRLFQRLFQRPTNLRSGVGQHAACPPAAGRVDAGPAPQGSAAGEIAAGLRRAGRPSAALGRAHDFHPPGEPGRDGVDNVLRCLTPIIHNGLAPHDTPATLNTHFVTESCGLTNVRTCSPNALLFLIANQPSDDILGHLSRVIWCHSRDQMTFAPPKHLIDHRILVCTDFAR